MGCETAVLEIEVGDDVGRDRKHDRARDLEVEAVEELDGRRHAADVAVLLDAQHVDAGARQQTRRGETVVARPDDDHVVVRHAASLPAPFAR